MRTGQSRWDEPSASAMFAASKVPQITAYFWIVKLLSTAMGEATSDYMVRTINPVIAVLLGFAGFVVAMVLQFRAKAYNAWIYWLAVVMVAVFGTQAADVLHIKFHVPYAASTAFYAIVLAVIFIVWYRSEGTLSIHSIRTPRRELFYWATVLATFALGTATGDLTARTLSLGYLASGFWFTLVFAAVAVAHWKFRMNPILAFWIAYVLTRPVGASYADYVAFPHSVGGLDVGHGPVALALTVAIVILVAYLARTRLDVEDPREAAAYAGRRRAMPQQPGSRPAPPRSAWQYAGQQPYSSQRYPGEHRYPADQRYPRERYQGQRYPQDGYPDAEYPGQRYPEERYPPQQYPGERYRGQRYPEDQRYPEERDPGRRYPRDEPSGQRYRGDQPSREQYPREQYPQERHPGRRYPAEQPSGQRYPGEPYLGEPYPREPNPGGGHPGERYPREQRPGEGYRGREQYPEERYPGSAPPPPPRGQRPRRGQRPSRRSWDDEDEAERTAEGFFAWDE